MTARKRRTNDTTPPDDTLVIESMNRQECLQLLSRHHVGRLAFAFRNRVDIRPISYIHQRGWIYGRTSAGTKFRLIAHSPWVAFEVDEIKGMLSWESVVVHGGFYVLDPNGSDLDRQTWRRARAAVRRLFPASWTPDDPVPSRTILFRIHIDEISGRRARAASTKSPKRAPTRKRKRTT